MVIYDEVHAVIADNIFQIHWDSLDNIFQMILECLSLSSDFGCQFIFTNKISFNLHAQKNKKLKITQLEKVHLTKWMS